MCFTNPLLTFPISHFNGTQRKKQEIKIKKQKIDEMAQIKNTECKLTVMAERGNRRQDLRYRPVRHTHHPVRDPKCRETSERDDAA
jgi:hypothetical protein